MVMAAPPQPLECSLDTPERRRQRANVPRPDPVPTPRHALLRRFWRIFQLLALLSIVIAVIAVLLVTQGEKTNINVIIATALGAGLTVLLGTALMTLVFLSADSGHDEAAASHIHEENDEE
jgi:hypothetical protein